MADGSLYIDKKLYPDKPELAEKSPMDLLREQLFYISLTLKGNSWNDLMSLPDEERLWLYQRCAEHWKEQNEEMKKSQSRSRFRRR